MIIYNLAPIGGLKMKKLFILLCFIIVVAAAVSSCSSDNPVPAENSTAVVTEQSTIDINNIDKHIADSTAGIEKNSDDMVNVIAKLAKNDAKNANDEMIASALTYIKDTYPNYFTDNATMEKTMYYGALLDYAFDDSDNRSHIGFTAFKSVKYVYRGLEKINDEGTKKALYKLEKELAKLK